MPQFRRRIYRHFERGASHRMNYDTSPPNGMLWVNLSLWFCWLGLTRFESAFDDGERRGSGGAFTLVNTQTLYSAWCVNVLMGKGFRWSVLDGEDCGEQAGFKAGFPYEHSPHSGPVVVSGLTER